MKWQKIKLDRAVALAAAVGAAATVMAWRFPALAGALSVGLVASGWVVSRFPWSRPRASPRPMNEFSRSSIDECACGQDAVGLSHHVCSAPAYGANRLQSRVEVP